MVRVTARVRRRHLHRIDHAPKRTHCWVVQVQRQGKIVRRVFNDRAQGGATHALRAAKRYRDRVLKDLHDPHYALWRRNCQRRNNTSGIVGVGRYVSRERSGGRIIERISWQAFWDGSDGKRHSRKFSVNVHGERRAKELACRARRAALRALARPSG